MINSDRNKDCSTKADYFDADFNHVNMTWGYEQSSVVPSKPLYFEKMKMLAEKLSKGMPHVCLLYTSKSISLGLSHTPNNGTKYSSPSILAIYSLTAYLSTYCVNSGRR